MSIGNVDGSVVDVKMQVKKDGIFDNRIIKQAQGGIGMENNSVKYSDVPTTKLDSRSAVIDQSAVKNIEEQINYNKNNSIKSFFGGVANKIKKGSFSSVTDAKEFKADAPTLNKILSGGVDGKLKPLKMWLKQDSDGSYSFMMQIKNVVNNAAVNEKIDALYAEAEKAAKNSGGNIQFDGKILIIDGKKINLPTKGYPENYIIFTASNTIDGQGKSKVTLVIPNTPESKKKFTEMSKSADEQLKILENINKLYADSSEELVAIEQFRKYKKELEEILGKFSDKTDKQNSSDKTEQEPINFNINSMPNEGIITSLLNNAEAFGITAETNITGKTTTTLLDSKFTDFAKEGNKIAKSSFTTTTDPATATVNIDSQPLAGNTCILYQKSQTDYELYTCKDGALTKDTANTTPDKIFARLGELRSSGTEILLAAKETQQQQQQIVLYTMGHGTNLDLMITGKSADGFTANISGQGVDKLQGSAGQKVLSALAETYSNLVKSGTKIDDLAKAKLEVAAMMIANREKYSNFVDATNTQPPDQKQVDKFIKDVLKQKYKTDLSKDDYGKLTEFVTTMAGKFTTDPTIKTALENIEKGDKGKIKIPGVLGGERDLTIDFAVSTQKYGEAEKTLKATKISTKTIDANATLTALTAAADPKFQKADKSGDTTQFDQLSLADKFKVLQQAQAKANLANQLVELKAKEATPKAYIQLLGQLACNPLLKDVKVNLNGEKDVQGLLNAAYTCLSAAHDAGQTAYKSDFKFDAEPFTTDNSPEKKALELLKSAGIKTDGTAQELFQAIAAQMKVDKLDAGKIETGCDKFKGGIAKAICNAQLVGLTLQN